MPVRLLLPALSKSQRSPTFTAVVLLAVTPLLTLVRAVFKSFMKESSRNSTSIPVISSKTMDLFEVIFLQTCYRPCQVAFRILKIKETRHISVICSQEKMRP
ncbi:hypothetical protein J6590_063734 [Homalodisca vitripennis]|nr:hypothetical protein J6590_063734 [Homalodisca vitripennis]